MLTQFQIIERQSALLAACPRPRTLALSAANTSGMNTSGTDTSGSTLSARFVTVLSAPSVSSAWSHSAPISFGFGVDERPAMAKRPATVGYAGASLPVATGSNGSNNGTQQNKQYLTARRGPVTWRPPR
jgi:hypothetical protein